MYRFFLIFCVTAITSFQFEFQLQAAHSLALDSIPQKSQNQPANSTTQPKPPVFIPTEALEMDGSDEEEVFKIVENMPSFPGGEEAMHQFIAENLQYPEEAKTKQIQGSVHIRFVVAVDGTLKDIEILRGLDSKGFGMNKEALRIVKMMPKWIPGRQRGRAVSVSIVLPIHFRLDASPKPLITDNTPISEPKSKSINVTQHAEALKERQKTKINTSTKPTTRPSSNVPVIEEGPGIVLDKVGADGIPVYKTVSEMPTYPDGQTGFYRLVAQNIQYPADARKNSIQGNVYVGFTIMEDGSMKNIHVKKGIAGGESCNEEAMRVMHLIPKWVSGKINGKPVRVSFVTPIRFKLESGKPRKPVRPTLPFQLTESEKRTYENALSHEEVEEMPEYPGGQMELFRFIGRNIRYPKKARRRGIHGTVYIGYVIAEDGSLENIHVKQGIAGGEICDNEALRIVHMMPKWIPGKVNRKPVRVAFTLPIRFKLE